MDSFGNFGPLIGIINVSNTHCRFMVSNEGCAQKAGGLQNIILIKNLFLFIPKIYSTKNAEILTFHEMKIKQIIHNAGWLEYDPYEILKYTQECIEVSVLLWVQNITFDFKWMELNWNMEVCRPMLWNFKGKRYKASCILNVCQISK